MALRMLLELILSMSGSFGYMAFNSYLGSTLWCEINPICKILGEIRNRIGLIYGVTNKTRYKMSLILYRVTR